ncbi:MAG: hypothetical protein M1490_03540 [Candidatus Bathyarchaeota archaeon]|nr:hypothetical protein [Candidatus Bathyarchaeota archaeon]
MEAIEASVLLVAACTTRKQPKTDAVNKTQSAAQPAGCCGIGSFLPQLLKKKQTLKTKHLSETQEIKDRAVSKETF